MDFLPITKEDMDRRGWDAPDFVYVNGDAYVDHPSFGAAIITRVLEHAGYRVAFLAQPTLSLSHQRGRRKWKSRLVRRWNLNKVFKMR